MLTFPEDYFQDEVRDGFYVPSLMKCTWAAELELLSALRSLFDRYGLKWYADYGTLLGAVRHGGFIPWDDDIDITMPRADYMTFLSHAGELPEPFRILSFYTSEPFGQFHAVASNTRAEKLDWDEERIRDFHGCPFIVNLDIYPLDYIPRDPEKRKLQRLLYTMGYNLATASGDPTDAEMKQFREFLERFYPGQIMLDPAVPLKTALRRAGDQIAMSCPEEESDEIDYYPHMAYLEAPLLRKKEWYRNSVQLPFEVTTIEAPVIYTAVLEKRFGRDYMRPVREAAAHGYPFYGKQLEVLQFTGHLRTI